MLPLFLLEEVEDELWLDEELEGVFPVLLFSDEVPEMAVAMTRTGAAIYLRIRCHMIILL